MVWVVEENSLDLLADETFSQETEAGLLPDMGGRGSV